MAANNFHHWFLRGVLALFGSAVISVIVGYISSYFGKTTEGTLFRNLSIAQSIFLFLSLLFFARIKSPFILEEFPSNDSTEETKITSCTNLGYDEKSWKDATDRARRSLRQFRTAWLVTISFWAVLYFIFYLQDLIRSEPVPQYKLFLSLCADLLNVGSHTALLACYFVLAKVTTDTENSPFGWLVVVAFVGIIELLLVLFFASVTPDTSRENAEAFVLARQLLFAFFGAVVGIIGGIVFGLFVGQLDNKHLNAPTWLLAILFGYAAIQPLYPILQGVFAGVNLEVNPILFQIKNLSPAILIGIAGLLKLLLFLFIYYIFTTGRLQFFCIQTRRIDDSVDKNWEIFNKLLKKNNNIETSEMINETIKKL